MAIYVVFFSYYIYFYNMYLHDLAWFIQNGAIGNTWSFGQIFAIAVWLPPVVEYIHLEMRELTPFSTLVYYSSSGAYLSEWRLGQSIFRAGLSIP